MEKNPVAICVEIDTKLGEVMQCVMMENPSDNPFIDAYNDGVSALYGAFHRYLNAYSLAHAFKSYEKGE